MKISVVIPVFGGAGTVERLTNELVEKLKPYSPEIILVNDGSPGNTDEVCLELFRKHGGTVKYICLSRNFGEHNAVMAGLNHAKGEYAVIIDDDFQNPPEEIEKLIDAAVKGRYDVVYSYYEKKEHSLFRNLGSAFNDTIASYLLNKPKDLYLSSFKCMNRFTVEQVIRYKGPFPYIDGLIWRSTKNVGKVLVRHAKREDGKSGYTFKKLVSLWLNMLVNFSIYPLRMSTFLGLLFSIVGAIFSIIFIFDKIFHPNIPVGVTSILVVILTFSGVQLIILGLLGEYLGKLFLSDNQTPQYIERSVHGCENK